MKKQLYIIIVFFFSMSVFSQNVLTGKIVDEDGKGIASASVTIEEIGKDAIMAYGITNAKGEFNITFTAATPEVLVKVKAFNHQALSQTVKNKTQDLNIKLQSQATEIKEVKLKTRMITKRGDTITYDLKAFDSKADRTLSDVLKKIPGIEVNSDGTVLYQGEAINKFYVNGKDLMEGGYGTVNNSLPKDAVQKIEVMENHQPIKILQNKVPSENAGLNIVLKKQITMTGRGELGIGVSPLLWNAKLTPMFFGQKNQWVVNYKANNNGESVEKEGNLLSFGNRWEGRRRQAGPNTWISIDEANKPDLPEKRFLLNNVHFFSANLLTNPFKDKEWELKLNTSYSNNSIDRDSYYEIIYAPSQFFPNGLKNTTLTSNTFYSNAAKGEMIFTKNAKKGFFKNVTTWNGFWNDSRGGININSSETGIVALDETLDSPTGSIQNSLSTIIPWKEKMINVQSYISYQKDKQNLTTNYQNFYDLDSRLGNAHYDKLHQNIDLKTLTINHSASVGFAKKKWTFNPEVGLNLNFNQMKSQLSGDEHVLNKDFQNDMEWNEVNPYTQLGINYKGDALSLNIQLPINYYGIDYEDYLRNDTRKIKKTVFEPTFWGTYSFASFFKVSAFGNLRYNFGNFGSLYAGNILLSPRIINLKNSPLPENRTGVIGSRFEYRNPLNNLFFNVRYSYLDNKNNLISKSTLYASGASSNEIIEYDNHTKSQSQSVEVGKYFPNFKTNFSVSYSNRDSNFFTMLVDNTMKNNLVETRTNSQGFDLKFNNTYFSWLSVDYNFSKNWYGNKNLFSDTKVSTSGWSHKLATYLYPWDDHTIGFFWDDINSKSGDTRLNNAFFDLSYQYTWSKKKIDFEIKWLNIANKKVYEDIAYNATYLSTSRSSVDIRPSQVMFTVKFNFK